MTNLTVHIDTPDLLPSFEFDPAALFDSFDVTLTTEHSASSYGQAVLIYKDNAYGPADLPGHVLVDYQRTDEPTLGRLRRDGWNIKRADGQQE